PSTTARQSQPVHRAASGQGRRDAGADSPRDSGRRRAGHGRGRPPAPSRFPGTCHSAADGARRNRPTSIDLFVRAYRRRDRWAGLGPRGDPSLKAARSSLAGIFVTGTDTSVGKTTVAVAISRLALRRVGIPIPYKPV